MLIRFHNASFSRDVQDEPAVHLHLLVVFFAFELETVGLFSQTHHLRSVKSCGVWVPG